MGAKGISISEAHSPPFADELLKFVQSGPLIGKLKITISSLEDSIEIWQEYGRNLCQMFDLNDLCMPVVDRIRVYHYYIPMFLWCQDQIMRHQSIHKNEDDIPPLVIGFSAPQGCGKTTLVKAIGYLFHITGRKCAEISLDDFYLRAEEQAELKEKNVGNLLLELRGNAGTHDLLLSEQTLTDLRKLTKKGMTVKLPRYDKTAFNGKGDRIKSSDWPVVEGPLTAVLFEGWMIGFKPLPMEKAIAVDPQLQIINKFLEGYFDLWEKFIDALVVMKIKDISYVYRWRLQAEISMKMEGKPGMSDQEVNDFVLRFMPAYEAYLPELYAEGEAGSRQEHLITIEINQERNPI